MKILLATDGSECSERAAVFLTNFDFSPEDEITILHVVSEIPYEDDSYANIRRFMKRVAPQILESSANILKPTTANLVKLEEQGYPDSTIMEIAENSQADLIVMGTRGIGGVQSLFVGSTARSVAMNAATPVLVTRHPHREMSAQMKVLLAADGSDSANAAAELLSSMPFPSDTDCMVINVPWSAFSMVPKRFAMKINEELKNDTAQISKIEHEKADSILEQAKAILTKRFTHIEELIRMGDPSMEILNAARTFNADIIALGCRGLKGMKGMMGSVSRRILSHSPCPVLIGKA